MTAEQIGELLTQDDGQMGRHLAAAVRQFDEDIGGLENVLAAFALLERLEEAA